MTVPNDVPPITTPKKDQAGNPPAVAQINPAPTNPTPANSNQTNSIQANSVPNPPPLQTGLIPAAAAPAHEQMAPIKPPQIDAPITTSTPQDPRIVSAADEVSKRRQADAGDLDQLAMDLRNDGLDAEHRQDYLSAQYYYQQVEGLSRDHWPQDIDQLLKDVQRRVTSSDAGQ